MTESTIDEGTWNGGNGHPDEGTLHAWLDGALPSAEEVALESHVAACEGCQARVAEARGLIAGASRIVRALDPVRAAGGGLVAPASTPTAGGSMWRLMRVTPTRAAIAASLIVALGITLTRDRAAVPTLETARRGTAPATAPAVAPATAPAAAPTVAPVAPSVASASGRPSSSASDSVAAATTAAPAGASTGALAIASNAAAPVAPDSTLHKAIARRIAADQPPRTIEASPVASAPMPPTLPSRVGEPAQMADVSAGLRVAAGRVAARAAAESAAPPADRARTSGLSFARRAGTCYRLERASPPGAPWSGGALPMTITLSEIPTDLHEAGSTGRSVVSDATPARAISLPGDDRVVGGWTRRAGDTLSVELRGSSLTTTGLLAPGAGRSTPGMRSGTLTATPTGGGTATMVRVIARPVPCG